MQLQIGSRTAIGATLLVGGVLFVAAASPARFGGSESVSRASCLAEKAVYEAATDELDRALAGDNAELAGDLARVKDESFARYCVCLGTLSAASEGVGSRAPLVTVPPRGTPSFAPPQGRPVFTPPAGPPAGRPPVTPPTTPRRGRPPFTPPGPPFTPPGPPPFTPPGPVLTPPGPPLTPPPTPTP